MLCQQLRRYQNSPQICLSVVLYVFLLLPEQIMAIDKEPRIVNKSCATKGAIK